MLRLFFLCVFVWLPGVAWASPAEPPPPEFAGAQFIDSKGCVFRRDGGEWVARHGPDGRAVCGYPPTFSALDAPDDKALRAAIPVVAVAPDRVANDPLLRVAEAIYSGIQSGDLAKAGADGPGADPALARGGGLLPDDTRQNRMADALGDAIVTDSQIKAQMSRDRRSNDRLCALLGYESASQGAGAANTAAGFCHNGDETVPDWAVMVQEAGLASPQERANMRKDAGRDTAPLPAPVPAKHDVAAKETGHADNMTGKRSVTSEKTVRKTEAPIPPQKDMKPQDDGADAALIPAGTQYLVVGSAPNVQAVDVLARQLDRLGYAVARTKGDLEDGKLWQVLAGPFPDREAVVRALNHLRLSGFPQAAPP